MSKWHFYYRKLRVIQSVNIVAVKPIYYLETSVIHPLNGLAFGSISSSKTPYLIHSSLQAH